MGKILALGSDHAGLELKEHIKAYLTGLGHTCEDFGTDSAASTDYPDYAKAACAAVQQGRCEYALLFCGTGVGMSMTANKMRGIRACVCSDTFSAEMTRAHNDANCLCLGGRVVGFGLAEKLVDVFLATDFETGGNHSRRVGKIAAVEAENGR